MTTPLPSRLRASAQAMRGLFLVSENVPNVRMIYKEDRDRIARELEEAAGALEVHPVAWRVRGYAQFKTGKPGPWRYFDGTAKPNVNTPDCCDFELLYTAPTAQVALEVQQKGTAGVATDGALSPHAAALDVETVLERLDFIAGHEASAILRDTAEAAAAMIRAAHGVATDQPTNGGE